MKTCVLLAMLLCLFVPALGQTNISGVLGSDATLTLANSPYLVTADLTVPAGVTLTINPKVLIRFSAGTTLDIQGKLIADGHRSDSVITFTSNAGSPAPGDYAGITFSATADPASVLSFCSISYAGGGTNAAAIYYKTGAPVVPITNCMVRFSGAHGVNLRASSPAIRKSVFSDNAGYGIYSDLFTNSLVESCQVYRNTQGGIRIPINSNPTVRYNMIDTNGVGIFVDNSAAPIISFNNIRRNSIGIEFTNVGVNQPTISKDTIKNNTQWGFLMLSTTTTVLAVNNYWGSESGPYNAATNPTATGNPVSNYVTYSPWLTLNPPAPVTTITTNIGSSVTWNPGVYVINGAVTVTGGALTIRPGTIVKFTANSGLYFNPGTALIANGRADSLIVFTSLKDDGFGGNSIGDTVPHTPSPGDYDAVYISGATASTSLNYCVFRYGGRYNRGGLYLENSTPAPLGHLYVSYSSNNGVQLNNTTAAITNSIISANGNWGIQAYQASNVSVRRSTVNSNGAEGIHVDGGGSHATLANLDTSVVSFNGGSGVYAWMGMGLQSFIGNTIDSNRYVGLYCFNVDTFTTQITGNTIIGNGGDGITTSKALISGNALQLNSHPIALLGNVNSKYSGNTVTGNAFNNAVALAIYRNEEGFYDTLTTNTPAGFAAGTYDFEVNQGSGVNSGTTFVIRPGVIMKFRNRLFLNVNGTLVANGTAQKPIVMTSWRDSVYGGFTNGTDHSLPANGDWGDIELELNAGAGNSTITNCIFKYGGVYNVGALHVQNGTLATPIANVLIRRSNNMGVRFDNAVAQVNSVTSDSNSNHGFYITGNGSNLVFQNSISQDNGGWGILAEANNTLSQVSNCVIRRNGGDGIASRWGLVPQVFSGNTVTNNGYSGIWVNSVVPQSSLQFIGNDVEHNGYDGIWSSAARLIDNTIIGNNYPIGVFGHLGNSYVDNSNVDGNVITGNTFNNTVGLAGNTYAYLSDTLKDVFPQAITSHTYTIVEDVQVNTGTSLLIQPGVRIKYYGLHAFQVYGTLTAQGTPASPIIFTSWRDNTVGGKTSAVSDTNRPTPGDWYYVAFRNGSGNSVIRNCQFKYGGRDNQQTVFFEQNVGSLVFANNLIRRSYSAGIYVSNTALVIDSTTIDSCSTYGIRLGNSGGNVVTVRYSSIVRNGSRGLWAQSPASFSLVSHCDISYNGDIGLYTENNTVPLSVQENTVIGNGSHGIYTVARNNTVDTLLLISGNVVRNNGLAGITTSRAIVIDDSVTGNRYAFGVAGQLSLAGKSTAAGSIYQGNVTAGNTFPNVLMAEGGLVGILGGSFPPDVTSHVIAIRGDASVAPTDTLIIAPGTILKFPVEWGSGTFDVQGTLKSEGTANSKIVFTSWKDDTYGGDSNGDSNSSVPGPGNWDRLYLDNSGSSNSHLLNTIVRYGGRNGGGGVHVNSSNAPIDSSFVSFSSNYGLLFGTSATVVTATEIHHNNQGIYVSGSPTPAIHYCNIHDNNIGLNNQTGATTHAESNYWGAASGPLVNQGSDQNLAGTGNPIQLNSGPVIYRPYLTSRTGVLLGDVSGNGTIAAYDGALVLEEVVGAVTFTPSQQLAADVTGDGTVSALDASYILQYVVGLITGFPGMGKVAAPAAAGTFDVAVSREAGAGEYSATLRVKDAAGLFSSELGLAFDSTVVTPVRVEKTTLTEGATLAFHVGSGRVDIAIAGAKPVSGSGGDIVRFVFSLKNAGASVPVHVVRFRANEAAVTTDIPVVNSMPVLPHAYELRQNYPNPFNPTTNIEYQLPVASHVTVRIFDVAGREIRTLVSEQQKPGFYKVAWDGTGAAGEAVSSGVYFYRIDAAGTPQQSFSSVRKMMLLK